MTEEQIKSIVKSYIHQALTGMDKENPKLDFKRQWYNLKDNLEINEFLKDTTAIANTPGLDGFIIIGFDDREKKFYNAVFSDSGLKDSSELTGLIIKRVDSIYNLATYSFDIDENIINVIHISPSFDKPHVIRQYTSKKGKEELHRVFVKHGTVTRIATKYDFDFMSYDKKNQTPEYSLHISSSKSGLHWDDQHGGINLYLNLIIENNGLRPVAIHEIVLDIDFKTVSLKFVSSLNKEEKFNQNVRVSNFIVPPFAIENYSALTFIARKTNDSISFDRIQNQLEYIDTIKGTIKLNTGKILEVKVELF